MTFDSKFAGGSSVITFHQHRNGTVVVPQAALWHAAPPPPPKKNTARHQPNPGLGTRNSPGDRRSLLPAEPWWRLGGARQ